MFSFCFGLGRVAAMGEIKTEYDKLFIGGKWTAPSTSEVIEVHNPATGEYFGKAAVACVTPPFSWTDEFIEEAWLIVRRCAIPVMISTTFFGLGAPGLQGGNITYLFGTVDRLGAFFVMASNTPRYPQARSG